MLGADEGASLLMICKWLALEILVKRGVLFLLSWGDSRDRFEAPVP